MAFKTGTVNHRWHVGVAALLLVSCTTMACKEEVTAPSTWAQGPIAADGSEDDWAGLLTEFEQYDLSLGLLNDDEFLYVSLVSDGVVAQQVMAAGLTVWLEPAERRGGKYGIRYPTPPDVANLGTARVAVSGGQTGRGPGGPGTPSSARLRQVDLLGPGDLGERRLPLPVGGGLEVAVQRNGPTLVYELRVPLARDVNHRMGLGVIPGETIRVGFETVNLRDLLGGGPRFPGRPGNFGGGGGPGGGGSGGLGRTFGGGRGGGRAERADPLELWATVELSTAP